MVLIGEFFMVFRVVRSLEFPLKFVVFNSETQSLRANCTMAYGVWQLPMNSTSLDIGVISINAAISQYAITGFSESLSL